MSPTEEGSTFSGTREHGVPMSLENQIIPVTDIDRAKAFYAGLGWRLDDDVAPMDALRIVQFTPPGSGSSITFGKGIITSPAGTSEATIVVSDIVAAHAELVSRNVEVSDVWHGPPFPVEARQPGADPERASYGSFCSFTDPDGNLFIVQEVTARRPGRIDSGATSFGSADALRIALLRAEAAHVEHQQRAGHTHLFHRSSQDEDWTTWFASYLVAEQGGGELPA